MISHIRDAAAVWCEVTYMIYFDNAATTLRKPDCVVQAVTEAMCTMGNSGRGAHSNALHSSRTIYEARAVLAELFMQKVLSGLHLLPIPQRV